MGKRIWAVLVLLGALVATGWLVRAYRPVNRSNLVGAMSMDMKAMKPAAGAVPVEVETVQKRDISQRLEYTGTVVGYNEPIISPRISGRVTQILAYPGQHVSAGQVLARLDAQELDAQVEQALSERDMAKQERKMAQQQARQAEALYRALQARIDKARQEVNAAKAEFHFHQSVLAREEHLYEAGAISREEYDKVRSDHTGMEARWQSSRKEVEGIMREREGQRAALGEARDRIGYSASSERRSQAVVKEKKIVAGYQQIRALKAGVVTARLISPGTYVMAGEPVLKLATIDPIRIQVPVAERDLNAVHIGSRLIFHTAARPQNETEAKVTHIFPSADPKSRTHIVEAVVPNFDHSLLPGQYVKASLITETLQQVPAVPTRAISQLGGKDTLWVVRSQRAALVSVEVGVQDEEWSEVDGLPISTQVITAGFQNLQEGQAVIGVRWGEQGPESLPPPGGGLRLDKSNNWTLVKKTDPYLLSISIQPQPPVAGENTLRFVLEDKQGQKISGAKIDMKTAMRTMNMGGPSAQAKKTTPGVYETQIMMGMSGLWQIDLSFSWPQQQTQTLTFELTVQ